MEELLFIHLSEEDFPLAIFEQLNGPIRYDPDRLANLKFNPLLSETYKKFRLSSSIGSLLGPHCSSSILIGGEG